MRRPRGPGGRFLTADEIAAQKASAHTEPGPSASTSQDGEDDDIEGDNPDKDFDMSVDSPIESSKPSPVNIQPQLQRDESHRFSSSAASQQPMLQPRPLAQQLPPSQQQQQAVQAPQSQPRPQPSVPQAPSSSFEHIAISHNLMTVGYHPSLSHPTTPAPLSPHPPMPDSSALPQQDHVQHAHEGHTRHMDMSSSSALQHPGTRMATDHPQTSAIPNGGGGGGGGATATPPAINLRAPYAGMQMHHVPHPHAHARQHRSYLNQADRLYAEDNNIITLNPEGLKGETTGEMLHFGPNASSAPPRR